jgi:hypothetical protein
MQIMRKHVLLASNFDDFGYSQINGNRLKLG